MKSSTDKCEPLPRAGQNSCSNNCPDGQPGARRRRWDMRRRRTLGRLIGYHTVRGSSDPSLNMFRKINIPLDAHAVQLHVDNANERCVKAAKIKNKDWGG